MVLHNVISLIRQSRFPVNTELQLLDAVADPIEYHFHGPGATLFDFVVCSTVGSFVVCLDGRRMLWMSHFL
jgi:hypothetical protein